MSSSPGTATGQSASTPTRSAKGARLGRFEISHTLGKGSQGTVYLAKDTELGRTVAIKVLRAPSDGAGAAHEARVVAGLEHANIVPVYEVGEHRGRSYVVYQYVEGRSLRERLDGDEVPVHQAVSWAMVILDAVGHAHAHGIVHRDLNPANIRIDVHDTARVLDFGVSAMVGQQSDVSVVGTASYLAPEQISAGKVGAGTDVFSLSLVLYEMLVGGAAIDAADAMAAMYKIAHEPIEAPSRRSARVDAELDAIVMKGLEKEPGARYATAAAMRDALAAWLDQGQTDDAGDDDPETGSALKFILRRMRRNSDFPAISANITEIRRKTTAKEGSSVGDVANVILKDYALATKLLKLVNSSFYGQYGGRISTVSRAVVILGFEQVRLAALSLLLFEHIDNPAQASELREAAGEAFLSGVIGRNLAREMGRHEPEEVFVCAMLKTLGRYLTIYYLAEEHAEIRKAVDLKGSDEAAAARRVLGVTYEELGMAVAREWQLPDAVVGCMRPLPNGPLGKPAGKEEALKRVVAFSNELRTIASSTPAEHRDAALAALRQRFEKAVPIDAKTTARVLEAALDDVREYAGAVGTDFTETRAIQTAVSFLGGKPPPEVSAAGSAPGEPASEDAPLDARHSTMMDGMQDITNALLEGCALNDVLIMILETIYRGCGFTRVVFCIANPKRQQVVARFGLGKDIDAVTRRFQFSWRDDDAFAESVRDRRDLVFPDATCPRERLPEWFLSQMGSGAFALLPVVVKSVCVGMIYADFEQADRRVTADMRNYLNTLRNQAALAVKQARA